ncbi:MAG TPA: RNase adapter RapZ [Gammaproteobacteria bacterium]|nr:RNase adapter RapZ [Gammaproteobacteria bacterium]
MIISGLSGSGKSVALHVLEDLGFYCIDNIPVALLRSFVDEILPRKDAAFENVGVGLDARNRPADIAQIPALVQKMRADGLACEVIFLQAADDVLLSRFSDTRRKHPLTNKDTNLAEAIAKERELLGPIINTAELVIDTTGMTVYALREQIRERIGQRAQGALSIVVESFGYKHGLPANADFVFDVRCLPNPYWEPTLRPLSGKDEPVKAFLDEQPLVQKMIGDIVSFLEHWIPRYQDFQRSYLTVAIGCTGGLHRSVYVAEAVAKRLERIHGPIRTQHHELP